MFFWNTVEHYTISLRQLSFLLYNCPFTTIFCTIAWFLDNCTRLAVFLQQTVDASKFPTFVRKFTQQPLCSVHHTALTYRDF